MSVSSQNSVLGLPSLADKVKGYFPIGVAVEPRILEVHQEAIGKHFNRLVAENSMKWGELCRAPNQYDFARADAIADFARQRGMKMTGHTFVWHQMHPPWLFSELEHAASKEEVRNRLRSHIFTMFERYADVVDNWDVVNEAISERSGVVYRDGTEGSKWFECFGDESYVAFAFEYARQAAQQFANQTKLYYNDYNIEGQTKRDKALTLVRSLRQQGLRVDGIGVQGHITLTRPTAEELRKCIQDIAREDLWVKVSELDISIYTKDIPDQKRFEPEQALTDSLQDQLAARYREVFEVFYDQARHLSSVMLWGVSDDFSWLNRWPTPRKNYPLLIDSNHEPKRALVELLK
jgi:endo-1,4-beta-xylanase